MKVVVTGANGFIGKNLTVWLNEKDFIEVLPITRHTSDQDCLEKLSKCDFVFHLAGANRPKERAEFMRVNRDTTELVVSILEKTKNFVPILLSSSIQAEVASDYGESKRAAEEVLKSYSERTGSATYIYRLPNVFGKWSRPHYNSAVATFCHNISTGKKNVIHDASAEITLCYVDDLCSEWLSLLEEGGENGLNEVKTSYCTTVGALERTIRSFENPPVDLEIERVGKGLIRALYSTYLSFLEPEKFSYKIPAHEDSRGVFCEVLKTKDSGQFSFFTAHPGVVRGGHYHHTKTEKFLVIKGEAKFAFRHIDTNRYYELIVTGDEPMIVTTVPGWSHNITNIGTDELFCMLWANEAFDPNRPDTFSAEVMQHD